MSIAALELETRSVEAAFDEQRAMLAEAIEHPVMSDSEVFETTEHTCTCIDEGTHGDFRLAGAGILDPEGFDHVVATMRQAGVTKVTSHADCGAVAMAAKRELGLGASVDQISTFGQDWAKRVAEKLGVPYEHLEDLDRPDGEHDASVIYVDLVGGFRPDRMAGSLPKGFVVSGVPTSSAHVAEQVAVAVAIALGDYGSYSQLYSVDQPLTIVLVGGEEKLRHDMVEKIHQAVVDLGPKVKIETLLVS